MKVFTSWAGNGSHEVAEALYAFFGKLECGLVPSISGGMDAGPPWREELHQALASSTCCVVCLSPQAVRTGWLFYEAAWLSLPPGCDQLLPYLISLEQSAVDGPLNQFHSRLCSKEETKSLLVSLLQKNEQQGKPSVHLQMASSRCHRGNSLTPELDRRFETHWLALESVIQTTLSKLSASGPADVLDRDSFDGLMDSYLDAVAHRMTLTFADSLENLRDELTSSVLANIGSMRHLVQMKERTISMEEIRAELRANGLPLRLETLIGDIASVVWQSREQLEQFHSEAVRLHLLDFVACQLSPAQLADCVLEALATLDTAERNQIYTYFAQRQNALRYRVEEMRKLADSAAMFFDAQLDTDEGREWAEEFATGSSQPVVQ